MPWSRLLLALTVAGPALWLGGVPVSAVPAFLTVVLLLWLRLCHRGGRLLAQVLTGELRQIRIINRHFLAIGDD